MTLHDAHVQAWIDYCEYWDNLERSWSSDYDYERYF